MGDTSQDFFLWWLPGGLSSPDSNGLIWNISYEHIHGKKHVFLELFPSSLPRSPGWLRFGTGLRMLQGMLGKLSLRPTMTWAPWDLSQLPLLFGSETKPGWGGYFWCCCWDLQIFGAKFEDSRGRDGTLSALQKTPEKVNQFVNLKMDLL